MKIKKLKYLFVLVLAFLVSSSAVFWACDPNPSVPGACKNTVWWAYDNETPVWWSSLVYLKMFGLANLSCANTGYNERKAARDRVIAIQNSMINNNCFNGCPDWFFWSSSSSALANCASQFCSTMWEGYLAPTLSGNDLGCDASHTLEDWKCCKPVSNPEPEPQVCERQPVNGACSDSWYILSWDCCVFDCSEWRDCSYWEKWSTWSCKCVCDSSKKCCWIQLNTVVPFIGDCIEMNTDSSRWDTTSVTSVTAFPILAQWLMKILMSAIMVFSFLMVIIAWLSMTTWAFGWSWFSKWKTILKNVIISLILLWCSWLILSLINPNFFGG